MILRLRPLTEEENQAITRLSRATSEEARLVQRAQILCHAREGLNGVQIARLLHINRHAVSKWIKRFNAMGLEGLLDAARTGAPVQYQGDVRAQVIATALSSPKTLGLPFGCWTTQRLCTYLHEQGVGMGKTRMFEILRRLRDCAGANKRAGLANGSIRSSRKKGGHRTAPPLPS